MVNSTEKTHLIDCLGRVVVLYGGVSAEREVSLQSGAAVVKALSEEGVDVIPLDLNDHPLNDILAAKADRAFIALHGPGGEDGKIQALLEFLQIPYSGSGVAASSLCMDKLKTKQLWRGVGLPTPDFSVLTQSTDWASIMHSFGRAMVKPCHEGSSIGMSIVGNAQALEAAYIEASKYDSLVLAEKFITGEEYTVAILNGKALPPIKLETDNLFYDFNAKYQSDDTRYLCPCGLDQAKEDELKKLAVTAFEATGASGWGRVDVMTDEGGCFQLLEVNTVPGMTSHSLVPMAAKASGLSFNELVLAIVQQTLSGDSI